MRARYHNQCAALLGLDSLLGRATGERADQELQVSHHFRLHLVDKHGLVPRHSLLVHQDLQVCRVRCGSICSLKGQTDE